MSSLRLPALSLLISLFTATAAPAAVKLPSVLSDHAVLRASAATRVWGWAAPDEEVNVAFANQEAHTRADAAGHWGVALDLQKTGAGPFELTVKGTNEIKLADILVGEVWLASGQSNMDFTLKNALNAREVIAHSANPEIRFFKIGSLARREPQEDVRGSWVIAGPETAGNLSAVAYSFASKLQSALRKPVGVIQTSWGGSAAEAWISPAGLDTVPDLKDARERLWQRVTDSAVEKEAFTRDFLAWLKARGREDHPVNPAAYAAPELDTTGWMPMKAAGPITGPGLPKTGVIWMRREIEVPAAAAGKRAVLRIGGFDGIERLYVNGKLVREKKANEYAGPAGVWADIPGENFHAGRNVLALRIFAPIVPPTFTGAAPIIDATKLLEGWLAKAEYELPEPSTLTAAAPALPPAGPAENQVPGFLYHAMICPFLPCTLSGFIWYQGETNAPRAWQYRTTFPLLITDWRRQFAQGDLPFYYCQLANFQTRLDQPHESDWAELRDAQSTALHLPKTGQAVLIDIGEANDIHPLNKEPAGDRLARLALAHTYGQSDVVPSGPVYASHGIEGARIRVNFSEIAKGLAAQPLPATYDLSRLRSETAPLVRRTPDRELEGFQICGQDRQWVWAGAEIDGPSVIVSSPKILAPVAVRYGWASNPMVNLVNSEGLPASPFRTDYFPFSTRENKL